VKLDVADFQKVPQFTRGATYAVDVSWRYLREHLEHQIENGLDLDPDFQRGHVWGLAHQTAYIEFCLRGGNSAQNIYLNCPYWGSGGRNDYVLVDGKQRLTAVLAFFEDKVPVFGDWVFREFTGVLRSPSFKWHVNDLRTRSEVLQWYLDLNTGGVVHTSDEIERVRAMLTRSKDADVDIK
jgi:hypothetical protein